MNARLVIEADGVPVQQSRRRILTPGEMSSITLQPQSLASQESNEKLTVKVVSE